MTPDPLKEFERYAERAIDEIARLRRESSDLRRRVEKLEAELEAANRGGAASESWARERAALGRRIGALVDSLEALENA